MRATEFLLELGNSQYSMPKKWSKGGGEATKATQLPSNQELSINITNNEGVTVVNFYVDGSQKVTGKGDAFKIISTVIKQLEDYVKKYKPKVIVFTSSLDYSSRIKLYDRLVFTLLNKSPAFSRYFDITDEQDYWPDDLEWKLDDIQDSQNQKIYVLTRG